MDEEKKPTEKKRLGRFYISGIMAREQTGNMAETLAAIRFFPTNVTFKVHKDAFEMIGLSEHFEEINMGDKIPFYELIAHIDEDNNAHIEVKKQDEFLVNVPAKESKTIQ